MMIRRTEARDYRETEYLTREAFWNVYRPGCDEHLILHNKRKDPDFVSELDCVLEEDGRIAAHIMYCRSGYTTDEGEKIDMVLFGPVSVRPDRQGCGLGSAIIRHTMELARDMGFGAVIISGNPAYYRRFGFVPAARYGIYCDGMDRTADQSFLMVAELREGYLPGKPGVYRDPDGYAVDDGELEAFEVQFPPKKKERRPGQLV